ncbi:MAG: hypothetical protein ACI4TP_01525 [Anaerotignum sp.]
MRRMRLIREAFEEIKEADPKSALTMNSFRRLVLDGRIPSILVGHKRMLAMEDVELFLQKGDTQTTTAADNRGIRRVM